MAAQQPSDQTAQGAPPETDYAPPAPALPPPIPPTGFVLPDLPDGWKNYTSYDGCWFSTAFSVVPLIDYNAFVQDADSKTQVDEQNDEWDLRTLRLMFRGQMKFPHPVDYLISVEANLQQQERALNPFFVSRGIGLRLLNSFAGDSMTWSVGWFNDWWVEDQAFDDSGNDFVGRFAGVPYFADQGSNYLHFGIDLRYIGADEGTLQFRGRPESNVTAYYVDSGKLAGDHANDVSLESLWGRGPFLVSGEYAHAWVDAPDSGDPSFWGGSVVLSYVLTGEHRPYDKKVAYARRILPQRKIGAFEIVGRYSHVDVADALVDGGISDRWTIGWNWWATRRWKVGFDYGHINLDRDGLDGITHAFHTRFQWVY